MTTPFGFPSHLYHCLLDEQPHYLIPSRMLPISHEAASDLMVNPRCWFSWHGPLPPDKAARTAFAEYFCPSECIVWVDDLATGIIWPFWVGFEYFEYLNQMVPGEPLSIQIPEGVEWVLREANILVQPNHDAYRRIQWTRDIRSSSEHFERGYTTLSNLIHPFHVGALRRYYRFHTRAGSFPLGDTQVERRYAAYNEAVTRFYQYQFAQAISDVAASVVKPSYSYFVSYLSGSSLPSHYDREQCEYSISICIDASPEPQGHNPWPIELQTHEGMLRVWQHIGDGLLYRGRYLPHSREELPSGYSSSSMLLHYVDANFEGAVQ
jgi:hypothetical protein